MASQQGRRELGDRSVFFPPAHPELPRQLYHRGGYVAGRRATENDARGKVRLGAPGLGG